MNNRKRRQTSGSGKRLATSQLTSLIDKKTVIKIRDAFIAKTKEVQLAEGLEDELMESFEALSGDEFRALLRSVGMQEDVIEKIIENVDVDDDGDMAFDEFINFILAAESGSSNSKSAGQVCKPLPFEGYTSIRH